MMAVAHGGEALQKIRSDLNGGQLSKSGLLNCVSDCDEALQLARRNLNRSADLVKSFKRLAVDQSSEQLRFTTATELVRDCMASLKPFAKRSRVDLDLSHDDGPKLLIDACAPFSQVSSGPTEILSNCGSSRCSCSKCRLNYSNRKGSRCSASWPVVSCTISAMC